MFLKPKSEIRKHYFLNRYVIITPGRAKRPRDIKEESVMQKTSSCVLCPDQIEKKLILDQIGPKNKWEVITLKNKYPAVTLNNKKAFGTQEVIIETPDHGKETAEFSEKKIEQVLRMYSKRIETISKIKNIDYILVFKNNGSKAGASLQHAHSQIFATQILPPRALSHLTQAQNYLTEHNTCPYCDIINKERKSKRVIFEDDQVFVLAPYSSEYHYEAWIITKRHVDNLTLFNNKEFSSTAKALKKIMAKLHHYGISFNLATEQIISNNNQHFVLKIEPRDSTWAGVEMESGLIINSVPPEEAAKFYKK